MKPPAELIEALKSANSVAFATHVNPDGDGLGSEAALAEALQGLGKRVHLVNADPTPERFAFLGLDRFERRPEPAELGLVMDTSVKERVGSAFEVLGRCGKVAIVDHHAGSEPFGQIAWVLKDAPSTGSMTAVLLKELGVKLTPSMAGALYAALAYDTGCFKYSNADPAAFRLAAELKEAGADAASINRALFESKPAVAVKLQALALSRLETLAGGKGAFVTVTKADFAACGAKPEDSDGIVEAARAIQGVEAAAFLREEEGSVKLSTRSKALLDCNQFCSKWGGGGHSRASGATLRMPLAKAITEVKAAFEAAILAL
jgi:phosphoesterase RecJ-like protein